uniref:Holin n=1 Tax=viral metagenome TaxID=1070528 RepID=A0A6M3LNC7_9ZZZZ
MNILSKVIDSFGGSIIKEGFDIVKAYFPPSMSDAEKANAQLAYERFVHEKQKEADNIALKTDQEFNQRIKDMEGTASDLKTIPILGHAIIFIRGAQRPIWGVFTLYADYMVFSKGWNLSAEPELRSMLFAINVLVLGFLFGERAVKNILPFIKEFVGKK